MTTIFSSREPTEEGSESQEWKYPGVALGNARPIRFFQNRKVAIPNLPLVHRSSGHDSVRNKSEWEGKVEMIVSLM